MSLSAVIFDFDGVILDSETPEYEAHRRIFERCGVTLTPEEWCDQIGVFSEQYADRWHTRLRELSDRAPSPEAFEAEKRRLFQELVSREPMRGIRELVDALTLAGVPMAVASSSPARWVVPATTSLGLADRFQAIVTGDDVRRRKPAPDIYLEALARLGADAAHAVAIEDSGPGIAAARAAGLKAIAVPHRLTLLHDLSPADLRVEHAGEITVDVLARLVA